MKKKFVKVVACATMLAMVLSFSGCGKSDDSKTDSDKKTEQGSTSNNKTSDDNSDKAKSIEEYVNSDEVQAALEQIRNTMTDGSMTIDIRAEGNKMVYSYQYAELEAVEGMEDTLKQGIQQESATFQETANAIKDEVDVDEAYLVIEYLDKNGTVICSEEFKAE